MPTFIVSRVESEEELHELNLGLQFQHAQEEEDPRLSKLLIIVVVEHSQETM